MEQEIFQVAVTQLYTTKHFFSQKCKFHDIYALMHIDIDSSTKLTAAFRRGTVYLHLTLTCIRYPNEVTLETVHETSLPFLVAMSYTLHINVSHRSCIIHVNVHISRYALFFAHQGLITLRKLKKYICFKLMQCAL